MSDAAEVNVYVMIEHVSLDTLARLIVAHEDVRNMSREAADSSPASYAETVYEPGCKTRPVRETPTVAPMPVLRAA